MHLRIKLEWLKNTLWWVLAKLFGGGIGTFKKHKQLTPCKYVVPLRALPPFVLKEFNTFSLLLSLCWSELSFFTVTVKGEPGGVSKSEPTSFSAISTNLLPKFNEDEFCADLFLALMVIVFLEVKWPEDDLTCNIFRALFVLEEINVGCTGDWTSFTGGAKVFLVLTIGINIAFPPATTLPILAPLVFDCITVVVSAITGADKGFFWRGVLELELFSWTTFLIFITDPAKKRCVKQ